MGTLKGNLVAFVSRKLFFSLTIFGVCAWLLFVGRLESGAFETITISVVAVYLTSNIATRYTVEKGRLVAEPPGRTDKSRYPEEYEEYVEEIPDEPPRG